MSGDAETVDETLARLRDQGVGAVASATLIELSALGVDPRVSALGAMAMELARLMDSPASPTSKSMCAGRLAEALDRLMELNPPATEDTPLDQIRAQRALRLAASEG